MKISEKISDLQTKLVAARDSLVDLTSKMDDSEASQAAVTEATETVEKLTAELDKLKAAEAAIEKSVARAVSKPAISSTPGVRVKDKDKADLFVKAAVCAIDAFANRTPIAYALEKRYGDDQVIKAVTDIVTKAAQPIADSATAGWAAELVREGYMAFMDALRPASVVPRMPLMSYSFDGFSSLTLPMRASTTPGLQGSFRAEGAPIPVKGMQLTSMKLTPKSLGVISHFTNELARRSTPQIEALIRDAMIQDTAESLDVAFLSATVGTAIVPAGMQTYATGANTAASGGTTTAAIIADVRGRLQRMSSQNMGVRPVWVMNPARWYGVQLAVTAAGTPAFPEAANGQLMGIPVITSTSVPSDIVFLIDCAQVGFAGGAPTISASDVATIHEENVSPEPIGTVGTPNAVAAPVRSLFQTNSLAIRTVWELDWRSVRPDGSVQTITACSW